MADGSKIEWTDATWNPITGCTIVSAGCSNCYAMDLAGTRLKNHPSRAGLTRESGGRPVWTGEVRLNEEWLDQPLRWKKHRLIFVCAHGDLFHESVPDEWIDRVFAVMRGAGQHTFQVLTKRPQRAKAYIAGTSSETSWPIPNVWLGTSVEDQATADERIPHLLETPAAVRFVSAEPLLGPLDLGAFLPGPRVGGKPCLHWVIVGGESGARARPMRLEWAQSLRNQCIESGTAFLFKQWGEFGPGRDGVMVRYGKRWAGRGLDGRTWDQMPGGLEW